MTPAEHEMLEYLQVQGCCFYCGTGLLNSWDIERDHFPPEVCT